MKPFSKIASILFALVALLHLARVIFDNQLLIDEFEVPMWVSIVGFIVPAILSFGLWKESKQ